jgi:hypothetical protein
VTRCSDGVMDRHTAGLLVVIATLVAATGCSDDRAASGSFAEQFCPAVMEWADASVLAVNLFQVHSVELGGSSARRAAYLATFDVLDENLSTWERRVRELRVDILDGEVIRDELLAVADNVRNEYTFDRAEAEGLADSSFEGIQVRNGSLLSGNEKARAIVFAAAGRLWRERGVVDANCGRHPPVTINLAPG